MALVSTPDPVEALQTFSLHLSHGVILLNDNQTQPVGLAFEDTFDRYYRLECFIDYPAVISSWVPVRFTLKDRTGSSPTAYEGMDLVLDNARDPHLILISVPQLLRTATEKLYRDGDYRLLLAWD